MKMGARLLLEIMANVQAGLVEQKDISDLLRNIDVSIDPEDSNSVELTSYVNLKSGGY